MGHGDKKLPETDILRLTKAVDALDEGFARFKRVIRSASSLSDLSPDERALFIQLQETWQDYGPLLDMNQNNFATPPEPPQAPNTPLIPPKVNPAERRGSNKCFDTLLLCGVDQGTKNQMPASQQRLYELGKKLDDRTKRTSVIAKLNRWKSEKAWLHWTKPEIITLTELGQEELAQHLSIVKTNDELDNIRSAMQAAWGFTPNL